MIKIAKPGGVIYLDHLVDEAAHNNYSGLHRWNFRQEGADFVIASPGRATINVSRILRPYASGLHVEVGKRAVDGRAWIIFVAVKD